MKSPEHEKRAIVEYVGTQAPDLVVEHAEKMLVEHIFDREYSVWDVHTKSTGRGRPRHERWWVISNPTNLYSQADFKSADYTLSFHIGLTERVLARSAMTAPSRPEPRLERTRRQWEQASETAASANEAEDFQAVGVRCRETLISFVQAIASADLVPGNESVPKASDVVHWTERIADAVASGASASDLRGYLKAVSKATWQYVGWLTHAKNAVKLDADLAVEMVGHVLSLFEQRIERTERGGPERCPSCGSYRVVGDTAYDDSEVLLHRRLCESCDWSEPFEPQTLGVPADRPARVVEGECIVGSDGPGA